MSSFNTGLSPDVVQTKLDDVFMQEWNYKQHPGYVQASSSSVFKQETSDRNAEIQEVFKGVGLWQSYAEEAAVPSQSPRIANEKTFTMVNFGNSIDIPKNFFDDNMHGSYEKMVRDMAQKGIATRDHEAFGIFRNSFTTAKTADGVALVSAAHVNLNGDTISNLITPALDEPGLNDAIVALVEQKDQAGVVMGNMPETLLVPPALFKLACEITDSEQRSGTADNDMNVYSTKYGINVATTNRLGAASGGSDAYWWLLGRNHSVSRWVRANVITHLIPYEHSRVNNYVYKSFYREITGAMDYVGLVGSNGTT